MKTKRIQRIAALLLTICCVCVFSTMPVAAASNKTVTRSYDVVSVDNGIKAISGYARDSFKITYNGKKVVSCSPSQTKKDLNSGMFQSGGKIKLIKKTAGKWTYQSVWKINLKLMPKAMQTVALKFAPEIVAIQKIGTIVQVTTTYEVNANGTLKKTKTNLKWFTTIAKYLKQVNKLFRF